MACALLWAACGDDSSGGDADAGPDSSLPPPPSAECDPDAGSFEGIQQVIFDGYGCTESACHGNADDPAGGLDLRDAVAHDNLIRVQAQASLAEPQQRVYPGEQRFSFLYQKLAAATLGQELPAGGGAPMPSGVRPLSEAHLEALRLWIRGGAPATGTVEGVSELLDCGQTLEPDPGKIEPPAPPTPGEGMEITSGPWQVEADSEDEVCFATYYDVDAIEGLVPDSARLPCSGRFGEYTDECFAWNTSVLTQDPQSHHSIIYAYVGDAAPSDPVWGRWSCKGGDSEGTACDPTRIGEPAAEGGADCGERGTCATDAVSAITCRGWGPDDLDMARVNIGGAQSPVRRRSFSDGVYSQLPTRAVVVWNSHAFNLTSEPTTVEQYLSFGYAGPEEREFPVRSIFETKDIFVQNVPPYEERTYCASYTLPQGARLIDLSSHVHKRGVLWNTWLPPNDPACTVASCEPEPERTPDYVSRSYSDPTYLEYSPPLAMDAADAKERTLKYCATFDNGKNYPELLKRSSTSVGSTCEGEAFCVGGDNPGEPCGSDQSLCTGGGSCDACTVTGGFTTEDEMFILLGSYYVEP